MSSFCALPDAGVRSSPAPCLSLLAMAVAAALTAVALPAASQTGTPAASVSTAQTYSIAPGPLAQVISAFAAQTGIALTFDAGAVRGQQSPGLQGAYTVESGLGRILGATAWTARRAGDGVYVLERREGVVEGASYTMPAVTVTAQAFNDPTTEGTESYGSNATTLFKSTQSLRQTPQPVTVVTRQLMEDRGLLDLTDVLRNVPGVTVDYTDSERVNYYSRGHQIDSLQVDGLTMNQGGSAFVQPDTAVLDRIEILRGAAGMLRGSGNPSATVNMVRKRPTSEFQGSARLTLGSWNRRRAEADISGPLNESGSLRGRLIAVADEKDFFQRTMHEDRKVLYGVLQADLGPRTTATVSFQHAEVDATGSWGGLPANFDGSQLHLPRNTYLGADWNRWNRFNQVASAELDHRLGNDWSVKLSAAHTRFGYPNSSSFKQTTFARSSTTNPYLMNVSSSIYDGAASLQTNLGVTANGPFSLWGRKHQLIVGAESLRVKTTNSSGFFNINPLTNVDIRNWSPGSYPEPFLSDGGTSYTGNINYTRQQGLFATTRLSLTDPLSAMLGARVSWWDYDVRNAPASGYSVAREITPYAGLVYDLTDHLSAYTSYSGIFAPQNATDRNGQLLQPVRGQDYEAGLKGEFLDGRLNASLSLFRINNEGKAVDDAASRNPCTPFYASGFCKTAGGKTRSEGWELEIAGDLTRNWRVMAGYTNTRTKFLSDSSAANVGQPLRSADPRHLLRIFTSYRLDGALQNVTLGGGVQAQSDTFVRSGSLIASQGGYVIYNAMASYQVNRAMRVQLNLNNIFDKVYYKKIGPTGVSNYYAEPRSVMLNMSYKF